MIFSISKLYSCVCNMCILKTLILCFWIDNDSFAAAFIQGQSRRVKVALLLQKKLLWTSHLWICSIVWLSIQVLQICSCHSSFPTSQLQIPSAVWHHHISSYPHHWSARPSSRRNPALSTRTLAYSIPPDSMLCDAIVPQNHLGNDNGAQATPVTKSYPVL